MRDNLPTTTKIGIFNKLKNWFIKIITRQEDTRPSEQVTETNKTFQKEKTNFAETLAMLNIDVGDEEKIENTIKYLFNKIQKQEMEFEELSNEELIKIIEIYKKEIQEKNEKLQKLEKKNNM